MDKIKGKNNLLIIELERLMKKQFTNLGDIVGDFLISIEVNKGVIITNPELMEYVKDLINTCATAADIVLDEHKDATVNEVKYLMKKLLADLEKAH
ncbi:MAG: hypothetical protein K2X69_02220 [Silvanigrellaceae bacterium]|nr:hypothetical protein [Silvanigrellaceae bacterium]